MGIQKHEQIDAEPVWEHVELRRCNDNVLVLLQHGIDDQRGGQRTFGGPVPSRR
jgi:hypothetical protein